MRVAPFCRRALGSSQSVPRGLVNNQNLVLNPKLRIVWEHIAYQLIRFKPFYLRIVIISVHPNIDLKVSRNLLQNMSCAGERWMRIALSLALPSKPRVHAMRRGLLNVKICCGRRTDGWMEGTWEEGKRLLDLLFFPSPPSRRRSICECRWAFAATPASS